MKKFLVAGLTVGILSTGVFAATSHNADAKVTSQNGIILHDDEALLEHELTYIDVLIDPHASVKTKTRLQAYFAAQGLHSISAIVKKGQKDGLDTSKYNYLLSKSSSYRVF
ncbi:SPIN family peroxidase inhibitor [Staphylococcus lutrae]|uniref:SPIN family peroxidase inhibitor n=1 Tax=Staphylococcus lutrae TaxID=155085 RepID=A0AAC9RU19_9STAP|nr:SPIN family peroxidase inhibitor [Staphylococcus lutrae]ARJ50787.1 hypothetical protein B5P37_05375 [Staphylococcus lutrae]PNZ33998.1 hypothetical protein CD134_11665 [Staphylococcus lutrae]